MAQVPKIDLYTEKRLSPDWMSSSDLVHKLVDQAVPDEFEEVLTNPRRLEKIRLGGHTESSGDLDPEDALKQVLEVSGSDVEDVYKKVRGRGGNSVRVLAAWWMVTGAGLPNVEVARRLKMSNAGVSRAIRRVRSEPIRKPDSDIVTWAAELTQQRENNYDHKEPNMLILGTRRI